MCQMCEHVAKQYNDLIGKGILLESARRTAASLKSRYSRELKTFQLRY